MTKKTVIVNIVEVRNPDKDAQLVAENIALAIERKGCIQKSYEASYTKSYEVRS